jgi:hypothetical protein
LNIIHEGYRLFGKLGDEFVEQPLTDLLALTDRAIFFPQEQAVEAL